jgi:tRNA wybutosine-synthesizing protein 3
MTASLHHAQPIVAAAINAGFRESGVQSLKNLSDGNVFPMVAVRSAGLRVESLVGVCYDHDRVCEGKKAPRGAGDCEGLDEERDEEEDEDEDSKDDDNDAETVWSIVSDTYCELLQQLANERFEANSERVARFEEELFRKRGVRGGYWEDGGKRRERKRGEGLRRREGLRGERVVREGDGDGDGDEEVGNEMLIGLSADVVNDDNRQ